MRVSCELLLLLLCRVLVSDGYMCWNWYYRYMYMYISDIRLVDGPSSYNGRLEIQLDYEWGTVCDDGFGHNEARVVCKMLGFGNPVGFAYKRALYGRGSGKIHFDKVHCQGYESCLSHCQLTTHVDNSTFCGHGQDVGVFCADELTFGFCVGGAVLLGCIVIASTAALVYHRKYKRPTLNCATAPLDATTWDLLLVIDSKDALTIITEQIMDALNVIKPSPKVKRTSIHSLFLHAKNTVKCKKVMFFLCSAHTTVDHCCRHILPKLSLKHFGPKSMALIVTDVECTSFNEVYIEKQSNTMFKMSTDQPAQFSTLGWHASFIKMYFGSREGRTRFYTSTLIGATDKVQELHSTLKTTLKAFGIQNGDPGEKISFQLTIKDTVDQTVPELTNSTNVPEFIFVIKPRQLIQNLENERDVYMFSKEQILIGIISILSKCTVVRQKYTVKKKPIAHIV